MTEPTLLILKPGQLQDADRAAMRNLGIIVLEVDRPDEVRFVRPSERTGILQTKREQMSSYRDEGGPVEIVDANVTFLCDLHGRFLQTMKSESRMFFPNYSKGEGWDALSMGALRSATALYKALRDLAAANERAERAERERDEARDDHLRRHNLFEMRDKDAKAAEALVTTLSEALEMAKKRYDNWLIDDDYDGVSLLHEIMDGLSSALAALPAKQGEPTNEA